MTGHRAQRIVSLGALALGGVLFAATVYFFDFTQAFAAGRRMAFAFLLALLVTGVTHVTRTWAWSWCFAHPRTVPFKRLVRVRLAGEALSYLTISSLAGDPLKVVLLGDRVAGRDATAAVALERIFFIVGTAFIVGIGAVVALATQSLSPVWISVYRGFAIGSGLLMAVIALVLIRRDSYLLAALRAVDRSTGTTIVSGRIGRFIVGVGRQLLELVQGDRRRLLVLTVSTVMAYGCNAAEVWLVLNAVGMPISFTGAIAVETFTRVISFASTFIPANIGALEASSFAATAAVGATVAGAPLALARRARGIFWAGVGLAIYPRQSKSGTTGVNGQTGRREDSRKTARLEDGKTGRQQEDGQTGRREDWKERGGDGKERLGDIRESARRIRCARGRLPPRAGSANCGFAHR